MCVYYVFVVTDYKSPQYEEMNVQLVVERLIDIGYPSVWYTVLTIICVIANIVILPTGAERFEI